MIRKATQSDFETLYKIGLTTPELQVSATEPFMDEDDFKWRLNSEKSIFLLAESDKEIAGFLHFHLKDNDKELHNRYACFVYLVVLPQHRGKGIATQLYNEAVKELKTKNITNIYCWANAESDNSMISFLKKQEYAEGHKYCWFDKEIR